MPLRRSSRVTSSETSNWEAVPQEQISELIGRRMIYGQNVMLVRWEFSKGAHVAMHRHPHEQVSVVEKGKLRMSIGGEEVSLDPGNIRVIPPNTLHDAEALVDCVVVDIFSPPREDFINGQGQGYLNRD